MDPISIASLIAMIAGAGLQYKASSDASKRQREQALAAQQRQLNEQNAASAAAAKRAADYDPTTRAANQQAIEQQLTDTYSKQVSQPQITAQGVQVGTTLPEGQGGTEYLKARAKEQAKTTASLHALAGLMARIGAPGELRRNEAVAFGDTAGEIGRIQNGAGNLFAADQVGIEAAGNPSPGMLFAGAALRAAGGAGMSGAGRGTTAAPRSYSSPGMWDMTNRPGSNGGSWLR